MAQKLHFQAHKIILPGSKMILAELSKIKFPVKKYITGLKNYIAKLIKLYY
jgi:hypothetical protein